MANMQQLITKNYQCTKPSPSINRHSLDEVFENIFEAIEVTQFKSLQVMSQKQNDIF